MALCGLKVSRAQEASKPDSDDNKAKVERSDKPIHAYRIDFSISEIEEGKKINTRRYSLFQNSSGGWSRIDISSRVSVSTPQTPLETISVGTTINCRVNESGEDFALEVRGDFDGFC